jgi:ketosteroid isomerase-like protein
VSDLIAPPVAGSPLEAVGLVAVAVSDGDLEAAAAQYERGAVLCPWGAGTAPRQAVRYWLHEVMELRLPVALSGCTVLPAGGVALVLGERAIRGTGPDCQPVALFGLGSTVVRRQPGGCWRIAVDTWRLSGSGGGPG